MEEDLDSSLSCITIAYDPGAANGWGYVNRSKVITSETVLDVVCWNECIECQGQTGIENVLVEEMQIYPNPSTGLFYIKSKSSIEKIIIYNSIGELVFVKEPLLNSREHNISINKNGLYFISIYKGGQITNKKLTILK
jgi:hypothetical protein